MSDETPAVEPEEEPEFGDEEDSVDIEEEDTE